MLMSDALAELLHHPYGCRASDTLTVCNAQYVAYSVYPATLPLFLQSELINWFKPKPKPKAIVSVSTNPTSTSTLVSGKKTKPTLGQLARELNFDLVLLRTSFFIECLSHTLVSLMPATAAPGLFVAFTTLSCLGTGVQPAVNSLALCILQIQSDLLNESGTSQDGGDAGRLFGALASIQSVGQMILGVR